MGARRAPGSIWLEDGYEDAETRFRSYLKQYGVYNGRLSPTLQLIELLKGDVDLEKVARDNGVWKDSYAKLGPGQLRMTVGNLLRHKLDACLPVTIDDKVI
jgi:hypothetical protein